MTAKVVEVSKSLLSIATTTKRFWFGDIVCMMVRLDFFNKVLLKKKIKHCIVLYCPAVMVVCVLNTTLHY